MSEGGTVHVVGAGLAGLSAALALGEAGARVVVHEAGPVAGGRCRSFHDAGLGCAIDNGNHLVLTGNDAVRRYLARVGAEQALVAAEAAVFPFVDLADGRRWTVRLGRGRSPLWLMDPARRVPGMGPGDVAAVAALALAGRGVSVAEAVRGRGAVWTRFWCPLTLAVLNAPPERASARLLWAVLRRTFLRGGRHTRPMLAPDGLGAAFIAPAVAALDRRGIRLHCRRPLRRLAVAGGRVEALGFDAGETALGPEDRVVLAVPPRRLRRLLPHLDPPGDDHAILNAHFRLDGAAAAGGPPLLGVINGQAQWIFRRGDLASVTVSAAETSALLDAPADRVTAVLWAEVRQALGLGAEAAPLAARVIREKHATFEQSPAGEARRLSARTPLGNLFLAGDHVDTGLPATIEGAIRSGETAAALAA